MSSRHAKLGGFAILVVIAVGLLFVFDPADGGFFPPCVFHLLTGLSCPGCGLTRAAHLILHGDFTGALAMNALLPVYALLFGALVIGWAFREAKGYTPSFLHLRSSTVMVASIVIVGFGVVRNLI